MILESVIRKVVKSQKERLDRTETGLLREQKIKIKSISSHALIIAGVRRCGKSTLLHQYIKKTKNSFYLNFETPLLYGFSITDFERLDRIILSENASWLFFDEIQIIDGWERYARQKLDENYKVIITGSNATLLSKELGTKLTGRHLLQELFPFSYTEFLQFKTLPNGYESFSQYMNLGGFPDFLKSNDIEQLQQLFQDLIIRDIVVRHGIKDIKNLQLITQFLISNVGNRITANKLKKSYSISATSTLTKWFSYLEDAYLISFLPMYKPSLRAQSINPHKVYAIDTGMVQAVSNKLQKDLGHILENLVFLHLRRKHQSLYYFDEKGECDFIAFDRKKVVAIVQVCYELNQENLPRELRGITDAMAYFKKDQAVIITADQTDVIHENGKTINVIPAYEYFLA